MKLLPALRRCVIAIRIRTWKNMETTFLYNRYQVIVFSLKQFLGVATAPTHFAIRLKCADIWRFRVKAAIGD
jgi:hypothetical protein